MDNLRDYVYCSRCGEKECIYGIEVECKECHRRMFAEHDAKVREDAIDEFVKLFEEIDNCEFAMFSLCLIKEKAEQLKEQK